MIWKRYKGRKVTRGDPDFERGIFVVEFSLRGHYVKQSVPEARNQREAEEAETHLRRAIFDNRFNVGSRTTKLGDFIDRVFLPWAEENKRTWTDDRQMAGVIKEYYKGRAVRDLTPILIEKLKSKLKHTESKFGRDLSPARVNRYLQVLSRILSMAHENGIIDSNPMSRVKRLKEPPPREQWLSGEQEDALLAELRRDGGFMEAFAVLPLNVGFRAGELLASRRRDFDMAERVILIEKTKTDRPRRVPLNARAVETLLPLLDGLDDDELVFGPSQTGRRRRQMLYRFSAAVEAAGIEDFHYHDLRHTFATRLRAAGVHEYDIADLLGHSTTPGDRRNTKVTRGYAHGVPSRLREAVEAICNSNVVEFQRKESAG